MLADEGGWGGNERGEEGIVNLPVLIPTAK